MSVKISGKVWELEIDPTEKLVLLALADYANHEGENVRPGNELLMAMTGLNERTIGLKIKKFLKEGLLEKASEKTGRGHLREFSIDASRGIRREYFIRKDAQKAARKAERDTTFKQAAKAEPSSTFEQGKGEPHSTITGTRKVESDAQKVESDAQKVESDDTKVESDGLHIRKNRHEPLIEPLKNPGEATGGNPLLPLLIERYKNIVRKPQDETEINWQAEDLLGGGVTVEELKAWLDWRRTSPPIQFIAEKVLLWREDQKREFANQKAKSHVGSDAAFRNVAEILPLPVERTPIERSGNWGKVLAILDELLQPVPVRTWFEPLREVRADGGVIYLAASDAIFREMIEQNYADEFRQAVEQAGFVEVVIEIGELEEAA